MPIFDPTLVQHFIQIPHIIFCCPLSAYDKWWFEEKKLPHFREKYLVQSYLKIEVVRDFYVTKHRISTSEGVCRFLGYSRRGSLRRARVRLLTVACIAARNQTFASCLSFQLKCPSTSRRPSLKKVLVVSTGALFIVRNRAFPTCDLLHTCMIVDRSMDPEVRTAKGQLPLDEACAVFAAHVDRQFSVDSQLQSQAASENHVALFRPSWKRKPFLIFVFRIWSGRMFIWSQWCAL